MEMGMEMADGTGYKSTMNRHGSISSMEDSHTEERLDERFTLSQDIIEPSGRPSLGIERSPRTKKRVSFNSKIRYVDADLSDTDYEDEIDHLNSNYDVLDVELKYEVSTS